LTSRESAPAALIRAVLDPRSLLLLDLPAWEALLSCARRNGVLAYLGERACRSGVIDALPAVARSNLLSARTVAARWAQLARWELDRARRVLQDAGIPIVALKGVAYLLRDMPHAATRLLSDVDIMVPRSSIVAAENALLAAGWRDTVADPYDQRYYREWSHELPPLQFPGRLLVVDVHHTICAPLGTLRPDPGALWDDSESCNGSGVRVLSRADAFLHAAVHLFFDSDFDGRFRDLIDLHEMVLAFGDEPAFWPRLVERARVHGLERPLHLALEMLVRVLGSQVPAEARREARAIRSWVPTDAVMARVLDTALRPVNPEPWPRRHRALLWLLYVRSHWLRLPAYLLLPHLLRKSFRRAGRTSAGGLS
jgi:hypothetical protein